MSWSDYLVPLGQGAWVTVQLTFWSTILGAILSFAAGIGKLAHNPLIKSISIA